MGYVSLLTINPSNIENREGLLDSEIVGSGVTVCGGRAKLHGNANLQCAVPDVDLALEVEKASLGALKNQGRHYAGVDFRDGTFCAYS